MNTPDRRPHVCFVAPFAYPVLAGDRSVPFVGGAEVQQTFLARELVIRGYRVSMICMDFGQVDGIVVDGVTVYRIHAPNAGLPVLRFLHPRLTSLWQALARADADIYYQRAAAALTGFVAAYARRHDKLSIYAGAHDMDFDPQLPLIRYGRDRMLFRWGVKRASAVVVQSAVQRTACRRNFARESTLVRSCYGYSGRAADQSGLVLWVATVKPHKRPELFVELARRCPEYRFRLVGGGNTEYWQGIQALASGLANFEMPGFVPFADIESHFDGASVFVNTSEGEGFPNTFLQAWSRGIPSISFFDPGLEWQGQPVGDRADTIEGMVAGLRRLKNDPAVWLERSNVCRAYFSANHSVHQSCDEYERLFSRLGLKSPLPA